MNRIYGYAPESIGPADMGPTRSPFCLAISDLRVGVPRIKL